MTVSLEVPDEVTNMLNALWDQLGVDINDRNQSLISIRSDLAAFVLKYVENEKRRVNDICEEINAVNNRITVAYDVLGIPRKEVAQTSSNLGLLQVLHLSKSEESQVAEKCNAMSDVIGHNLQQIQNVYCELGMEIPEEFSTVGDVDLSSGRLAYVEAALEQANQEKSLREAKLGKLIVGIDELTVQLDQSRLDTFSITTDSLGKCEAYLRSLQDAMELNRREFNEVGKHVADLWALLKSDQDHILRFKQLLRGTLATDLRMYKKELENLSKIYEESLPILAKNALERIANLQIELRMLPSVGSQPRELGKITTETIKILEKEEADLMVQLEKSRCLLQLVGKWETSRSEMIQGQLEAKAYANDPNRFHGRQAFKMLKKEEDVRRLESKILPRLQEKLCTAIQTWERDQGHPFLVDNTPFLQTINSLIQSDKENSLLFSPSRTASPALGTKSITTPSPVVSRRHSISSLKKTPESSSKRGGVESAIKPQRLRMGSFEDKPCLPPRVPITDHFVAKALEQADAALATAASTESSSRQALTSMTQAIKELEATGPNSAVTNSDALCDLYHKRSVVYTALGEYDAALNDSEAALTHGHPSAPTQSCIVVNKFATGIRAVMIKLMQQSRTCTDPTWVVQLQYIAPLVLKLATSCKAEHGNRNDITAQQGNNLRAGLSLTFTIDQYRQVESEFDAAIWICIACFIIEYIALFSGVSIMKNAQNGFLSCLHLLGTVLLSWFILDSWHYKSFWYLVVCCRIHSPKEMSLPTGMSGEIQTGNMSSQSIVDVNKYEPVGCSSHAQEALTINNDLVRICQAFNIECEICTADTIIKKLRKIIEISTEDSERAKFAALSAWEHSEKGRTKAQLQIESLNTKIQELTRRHCIHLNDDDEKNRRVTVHTDTITQNLFEAESEIRRLYGENVRLNSRLELAKKECAYEAEISSAKFQQKLETMQSEHSATMIRLSDKITDLEKNHQQKSVECLQLQKKVMMMRVKIDNYQRQQNLFAQLQQNPSDQEKNEHESQINDLDKQIAALAKELNLTITGDKHIKEKKTPPGKSFKILRK